MASPTRLYSAVHRLPPHGCLQAPVRGAENEDSGLKKTFHCWFCRKPWIYNPETCRIVALGVYCGGPESAMRVVRCAPVGVPLAAIAMAFLSPLRAQEFRAVVAGIVKDPSGARVAAATVTLRADESSERRRTSSNSSGEFRFDDLLPGGYSISAVAPGFAEGVARVHVAVSSALEVEIELRPPAMRESVNVTAQPSSITAQPIDKLSAVQGGVVTRRDLEEIPLAHRS